MNPPAWARPGAALRCRAVVLALASALSTVPAISQPVRPVSEPAPVHVPGDERIEEDLLAVGKRVLIEGEVDGDAIVFDGELVVRGRVTGDAIAIGGRVRLEDGASVGGEAFSLFGGVDLAEGAKVGGKIRELASLPPEREAGYLSIGYSPPVLVARFLGLVFWLLAALAAAFLAPTTVARSAAELERHPGRLILIGALLALSYALSLVLSVALIPVFIGIPLLVLLLLAGLGLVAVALAAAFQVVGSRIGERLHETAPSGYVQVLVGALLLGLLHFVPVLGELAWLALSLGGAGAVLATRFGRSRRPAPA